MEKAYFAGGCFWCVEAIFKRVNGVVATVSGYCNGITSNPTYQDVCTGSTGHAEAIEISFDKNVIAFEQLLVVLFATHDASTKNAQGADVGTQYRSGIFYVNDEQKQQSLNYIKTLPNNEKITTEILPLDIFYPAENYHQNYYELNQSAPYCQAVIAPKIKKFFK